MTSPSPTLPPLTAAELQQQQCRRLQLYGGLSEGLASRRAGEGCSSTAVCCLPFSFCVVDSFGRPVKLK
jgi:hypothetical protein